MNAVPDVQRIADAIRVISGIAIKPNQYDALIAAYARACRTDQPTEGLLRAGDPLFERLIDEVTVKETWFLRDRPQLDLIDWKELLRICRSNRHDLRVWSVGCATGEEAYSLAMLACEAFGTRNPPVHILGTDISAAALERARSGRFRERSLRDVDSRLREHYFWQDGADYVVHEWLTRLVSFEKHNVVSGAPPAGAMDCGLVLCRNVLIYFDAAAVAKATAVLRGSVLPGGRLVLGPADALVFANYGVVESSVPRRTDRDMDREQGVRSRKKITDRSAARTAKPAPVAVAPPPEEVEAVVREALLAANSGNYEAARNLADRVLERDHTNLYALFIRGMIECAVGSADAAVSSLRAALYCDPDFGLASFFLARAYDRKDDAALARDYYRMAQQSLEKEGGLYDHILAHVEPRDVVAACRARLAAG